MNDGNPSIRTCTPCLRGHHAGCTTPATCAHHGCPTKHVEPVRDKPAPVTAKRSAGTTDRLLLERAYETLSTLRRFSHPGLFDAGFVELVHDLEERLNMPLTPTLRDAIATDEERSA